MNESTLVSLDVASKFIASIIAEYDWFLQHIKSGQHHLPAKIRAVLDVLAIDDYPKHYKDENALAGVFWDMAQKNPSLAQKLGADKLLETNSEKPLDPLVNHLSSLEIPEDSKIDNLDFSEKDKNSDSALFIKWSMLWLHEMMALMVHGERITTLVKKAISGDRAAYFKVLQIDPTAFRFIPEFKTIHEQAMLSRDRKFLNNLNYYINNRPSKSRQKKHHIYPVLFFLQIVGLLKGMSNKQLLLFLDDCGFTDYENFPDERSLGLVRKKYLESQNVN